MTFAFVLMGAVCGYLVWRGSRNIWNSILAGLLFPLIGIIAFGSVIGRNALEASPSWLIVIGAVAGVAAMVILLRR